MVIFFVSYHEMTCCMIYHVCIWCYNTQEHGNHNYSIANNVHTMHTIHTKKNTYLPIECDRNENLFQPKPMK